MGWDSSTQILTAPFTKIALNGQGDLQNALGRTTCFSEIQLIGDVDANGNPVGAVNMWAKYKSVKNTAVSYADQLDANMKWKSTATWWKDYYGRCGLIIPTATALGTPASGFFADLLSGSLPWSYDRPVAGTNLGPLRAYDFIGYYAGAMPFMHQNGITQYTLDGNNSLTLQWPYAPVETIDEQLQLTDVSVGGVTLDQMYFGALVYYGNSNGQYAWAATKKIAEEDLTVEFTSMSFFKGKTVSIVPFLSTKQITQGGTPAAPVTYCSFNLAPITATISEGSSADDHWSLSAVIMWNTTNTVINYTLNYTQTIDNSATIYVVLVSGSPQSATALQTKTHTVAYTSTQATLTGTITYTRVTGVDYYVQITARTGTASTTMRAYQVMDNLEPDPRT